MQKFINATKDMVRFEVGDTCLLVFPGDTITLDEHLAPYVSKRRLPLDRVNEPMETLMKIRQESKPVPEPLPEDLEKARQEMVDHFPETVKKKRK